MIITRKHMKGYSKVAAAEQKDMFGGITFNEDYNRDKFGIDSKTFYAICKAVKDIYGQRWLPVPVTDKMLSKVNVVIEEQEGRSVNDL
jgi:hypothetical protein